MARTPDPAPFHHYREHTKLAKYRTHIEVVRRFLLRTPYQLAQYGDPATGQDPTRLYPVRETPENIAYDYYGIDAQALEAERQQMRAQEHAELHNHPEHAA